MRILQIMNLGYVAGGAEKSVQLIQEEMVKRGHVVRLLTTDKCPEGKESIADVTITGIRAKGLTKFVKYSWYEQGRKQVRKLIKEFQPDVIHIHTIGEFSPSVLWSFDKKIPAVMTVHGPEGFVRKLLPWQLQASDYRQHSYRQADLKLIGRLRTMYFLAVQRPLFLFGMRRLRTIIAPSKFMLETLRADVKAAKLLHIYNGIELSERSPVPHNQTILFVGRLEAVKGIAAVVTAMKSITRSHPQARLLIVGDGSERAALEAQVKHDKLKNVTFTGWVTSDKAAAFNQQATMMVIPSVWPENLPTVALEALGTGRAIVGSDVGGIPELIQHGSNGFVVRPDDQAPLAEAIMKILSDQKLADKMGAQSAILARNFDIKIFIDRLEKLYLGF